MTFEIHELLQLSRIGEELRRTDAGLVRRFIPRDRRHPTWREMSYMALSVSAVLAVAGLTTGSTATFAAGGVLLATVYPGLLRLAQKVRRKRTWPTEEDRVVS
jgi:hypothetical protein